MDTMELKIQSDDFNEIAVDIKQRNLSKNNMPKLIVGTGLSITYGVPGMQKLAEYLNTEIAKPDQSDVRSMWEARYAAIQARGLEAGLANITGSENILVDVIKKLTAKYILESEENLHQTILERDTGFSRLLRYLAGTAGVNHRIIDIMTPNYDRIIEMICDKLGIGIISGFQGNVYCRFQRNMLRQPERIYNCKKQVWVRLFKPHGSINWVNEEGKEYLTNDYSVLHSKAEYIEIVAPGSSKYRESSVNNTFRCMREDFNELLRPEDSYSLLFYGYGFNDDHFDTALFDSFYKDVLILARDVRKEILDRALSNRNITIFYQEKDKEYMIYKIGRAHV